MAIGEMWISGTDINIDFGDRGVKSATGSLSGLSAPPTPGLIRLDSQNVSFYYVDASGDLRLLFPTGDSATSLPDGTIGLLIGLSSDELVWAVGGTRHRYLF